MYIYTNWLWHSDIDAITGELIDEGSYVYEDVHGRPVKYETYASLVGTPDEIKVCPDCGRLIIDEEDGELNPFGEIVCHNCRETQYIVCPICGETVRKRESQLIYSDGSRPEIRVCRHCLSAGDGIDWIQCDDCGDYYYSSDNFVEINGRLVCPDCADEYGECCSCGRLHRYDSMYYDDYEDAYYCDDCWSARRRAIGGYHSHDRYCLDKYNLLGKIDFIPLDFPEYEYNEYDYPENVVNDDVFCTKNQQFVGLELEVENPSMSEGERCRVAMNMMELMNDHIYCEHDGSLEGGTEYIFKPHTPQAFEHQPLQEMLERFRNLGFTSHDNGDCGLHIHFSNEWFGNNWEEQDENVAKVIHLYSKQYDFFLKCSRRTRDQADEWARRYVCENHEEAKKGKDNCTGHGVAVNLQNMRTFGTVEFRLGRGTLIYESFMAWYDMHLAIVRNVRNIEPDNTDLNEWLRGIKDSTAEYIERRTGIVIGAEREVA